jgi:rfaE bifunctional protein kinase chain/domain
VHEGLNALIDGMARIRVVVVGDLILDEYITGRAERLSREAPIPVLEFERRMHVAGGAANPAANIARLGAAVRLIGVAGADAEADALRSVLTAAGIPPDDVLTDPARPTTLKTRIMAHMGLRFPQQVARIDRLSRAPIDADTARAAQLAIAAALPDAHALLFSDYRGGMLTTALVRAGLDEARARGVLTAADAQGDFDKYRGIDVIKCNADEAAAYLGRALTDDAAFGDAARSLYEALAVRRAVIITRGADGATAADASGVSHQPAPAVTDVYDTVGAGDTAIAVLTLALAAGGTLAQTVALANSASGIVVRRVGNYAPHRDELRAALTE